MLQKRLSLCINYLINQFTIENMRRSQLIDLSMRMETTIEDYKYYQRFIGDDVKSDFDLLLEELNSKIKKLQILIDS